jgi:hypothetical protein
MHESTAEVLCQSKMNGAADNILRFAPSFIGDVLEMLAHQKLPSLEAKDVEAGFVAVDGFRAFWEKGLRPFFRTESAGVRFLWWFDSTTSAAVRRGSYRRLRNWRQTLNSPQRAAQRRIRENVTDRFPFRESGRCVPPSRPRRSQRFPASYGAPARRGRRRRAARGAVVADTAKERVRRCLGQENA